MKQVDSKIGVKAAIGCFIIMFIHLGTIGTAGLFMPEIIKSLNISVSMLSLKITITSLTGFVFSLLVGKLSGKITVKNMIIIGSIAGALHFYLSAIAKTTYILYLAGAFGGITFGFGTQTCNAAVISQWFKEKRATVIGIVVSGAAFGSAIMMFVSGILINSVGWRYTYIIYAALHVLVAIPTNLILIKEKKVELDKADYPDNNDKANKLNTNYIDNTLTIKEIRRSSSYWILMFSMILCGTLVTGFKTFVPSFWQANGMSALISSKYISIFMVIATLATMISGNIADRFGNKIFINYLHIAFVIGISLMLLLPIQFAGNIIISILFVGISYPLYGSIPATVTIETFGYKNYEKVSGELMAAFYVGLATVSPLIGILRDITGTYKTGFIVITVLGIMSCLAMTYAIKISPLRKVDKKIKLRRLKEVALLEE